MTKIKELHKQAMDLTELAIINKIHGKLEESFNLFNQAFELEKQAALLLLEEGDNSEPSRSILFKSAASLALNFDNFREAEKMISFALSGNPLPEIADELRDLFEQVSFQRHKDGDLAS